MVFGVGLLYFDIEGAALRKGSAEQRVECGLLPLRDELMGSE